jgi:DNA-binding NarL/FixJ family response regulator
LNENIESDLKREEDKGTKNMFQSEKKTKRPYVLVPKEQRVALIRLIDKGLPIKEAASKVKINYSTAKHIVKQHRL